jgi:hypothetical protein
MASRIRSASDARPLSVVYIQFRISRLKKSCMSLRPIYIDEVEKAVMTNLCGDRSEGKLVLDFCYSS